MEKFFACFSWAESGPFDYVNNAGDGRICRIEMGIRGYFLIFMRRFMSYRKNLRADHTNYLLMGKRKSAITGVAGYVVPRHRQAIAAPGHEPVAVHDQPEDAGVQDRSFPDTDFTTDPATFGRSADREPIDYQTVCTPNHLHAAYVAMESLAVTDAICEKPLGMAPQATDRSIALDRSSVRRVRTIMQLRLHPEIVRIGKRGSAGGADRICDIELIYITSAGRWHAASWKDDPKRGDGVSTNIGVHFHDMLLRILGPVERNTVRYAAGGYIAGFLQLRRARVRYLSNIDARRLPLCGGWKAAPILPLAFRRLHIAGEEFDFSQGFTDLHMGSYRRILAGEGFSPCDAYEAGDLPARIRSARTERLAAISIRRPRDSQAHPAPCRNPKTRRNWEIRMVDFRGPYERVRDAAVKGACKAIAMSSYVDGEFARAWSAGLGVRHPIPCGSATDALLPALMAIGLKAGDEVTAPAFAYIAPADTCADPQHLHELCGTRLAETLQPPYDLAGGAAAHDTCRMPGEAGVCSIAKPGAVQAGLKSIYRHTIYTLRYGSF